MMKQMGVARAEQAHSSQLITRTSLYSRHFVPFTCLEYKLLGSWHISVTNANFNNKLKKQIK
jgi:hypothetical protein